MIKKPYRLLAIALTSITTNSLLAQDLTYSADLLTQIRDASRAIPGALPTSINFVKFAESHRTYSVVIEDGGKSHLFQLVLRFRLSIKMAL